MRACSVLVIACLAAAASGCGGDDGERAQRPPVPVDLDVSSPADDAVMRDASVEVRGTVEPAGSAVRVMGRAADVGGSTWSADVALEPGANVIDVIATARGRAPALTAVRVTREQNVEVPDLDGLEVPEAQERVGEVGLELEVEEGGGLFDDLLPGEPAVCRQEPEAGAQVRRGTAVRVETARSC
jgi:Glucodextranase, domain B/PASTA domain